MTPQQELDLFMAAFTVYKEASGESFEGKVLVAQTILNRANDAKNRWPKTLTQVALQKKQFSCWNIEDPNIRRFPMLATEAAWMESVAAVGKVMANAPVSKCNHYHTKGIAPPPWADPSKIVATVGNHIFYEL
jgi:spore germination cell wall hydrolase CwlJ-like protein